MKGLDKYSKKIFEKKLKTIDRESKNENPAAQGRNGPIRRTFSSSVTSHHAKLIKLSGVIITLP